jgi:hypothetical protein
MAGAEQHAVHELKSNHTPDWVIAPWGCRDEELVCALISSFAAALKQALCEAPFKLPLLG